MLRGHHRGLLVAGVRTSSQLVVGVRRLITANSPHVIGLPPEPKFSRPLPTCAQRNIKPTGRSSSTSQQVQRSHDQGAYSALSPLHDLSGSALARASLSSWLFRTLKAVSRRRMMNRNRFTASKFRGPSRKLRRPLRVFLVTG